MAINPLAAALFLALAACAQTGDSPAGEEEPETKPADDDGPGGPAGSEQCEDGYHACGQTCLADSATNDKPELGCALGCGQPCPTPANGVAICTDDGICGFECEAGFARLGSQCVASVCDSVGYGCGTYTDDDGTSFSCGTCAGGSSCGTNHQCTVAPDAKEPNDTAAQAKYLGSYSDYDELTTWTENLNIHSTTDEDWFKLDVVDAWDGGAPRVKVELARRDATNAWLASPHELTIWWKCKSTDGDDGTSVNCGEWYTPGPSNNVSDPVMGKGCKINATQIPWAHFTAACKGWDESGSVTVRVRRLSAPLGDDYDVFVRVE
ncbi:MAG TPA: hypothetical protein VM513_02945 [Kofleriaceae bacterium]|jgi:hypothetical protein|nr:hypothetical protein [Kofleriaceae bacterium]